MGLVYSTDKGRICPDCVQPILSCKCKKKQINAATAKPGKVKIQKERKGRNGKDVTVISGLGLTQDRLEKLAKDLKARCGAGGTVKDGTIEIQGDHVKMLPELLLKLGIKKE